jgi:ADP-heptose:LPS heptosyltransferase
MAERASPPVRSIAVLRPNHRLGNTLLLMPLVQELEKMFPDARVELVTACGATGKLFRGYPLVSAQLGFPSRSYQHPGRVLGTLWALRRRPFDLAIDPIPRSRAGRFLLQWVRARERVGFRWGMAVRDRGITHFADPAGAPSHFGEVPVYLLRRAYLAARAPGAEAASPAPVPMELRLTEAERRDGERRLAGMLGPDDARAGPRLALFANATGQKGFGTPWWRELVDQLRHRLPASRLLEIVPEDARPRLPGVLPGIHTPDLRLLAATLAAASLFVTGDGGVLHLAEAAGARVLGLFRASDPARYGPLRQGSEALWALETGPVAVAERIVAMLYGRAEAVAG